MNKSQKNDMLCKWHDDDMLYKRHEGVMQYKRHEGVMQYKRYERVMLILKTKFIGRKSMNIKLQFEEQLARDYNASLEEVQSNQNVLTRKQKLNGARNVGSTDTMLQIGVYKEKLLITAKDEVYDWCKMNLLPKSNVEWICEPEVIYKLNQMLDKQGQFIADGHHYYLPIENTPLTSNFDYEVKWYEGDEIIQFEDDERFDEALLFSEGIENVLAVCAVEQGKILGMAGCTNDGPQLWQIGVNVTEEGYGKGIGTYVTWLLKNRVLEMGKIPYYGTVESHIKSQKVAIQAGFMPVFYEMFSDEI